MQGRRLVWLLLQGRLVQSHSIGKVSTLTQDISQSYAKRNLLRRRFHSPHQQSQSFVHAFKLAAELPQQITGIGLRRIIGQN